MTENDIIDILANSIIVLQDSGLRTKITEMSNELLRYKRLEKEIGCSLDIRCKVVPNSYIYTFGTSYMETQDIITRRKVITISQEGIYISYTTISGKERDMLLPWGAYKMTWWLKEDKSE